MKRELKYRHCNFCSKRIALRWSDSCFRAHTDSKGARCPGTDKSVYVEGADESKWPNTPAKAPLTETRALPQFLRLIVQVEATRENSHIIDQIAVFAEAKMPMITGYKIIKTAHETVHAIESYGSRPPQQPRAIKPSTP